MHLVRERELEILTRKAIMAPWAILKPLEKSERQMQKCDRLSFP